MRHAGRPAVVRATVLRSVTMRKPALPEQSPPWMAIALWKPRTRGKLTLQPSTFPDERRRSIWPAPSQGRLEYFFFFRVSQRERRAGAFGRPLHRPTFSRPTKNRSVRFGRPNRADRRSSAGCFEWIGFVSEQPFEDQGTTAADRL